MFRNTPRRRQKVRRYVKRLITAIAVAQEAPNGVVFDIKVARVPVSMLEVFLHGHGVKRWRGL